jgi:coatomer subunit zeta
LNEHLDLLLLAIDEVVDDGIIIEIDSTQVTSRIAMKGAATNTSAEDQSLGDAINKAREHFAASFR